MPSEVRKNYYNKKTRPVGSLGNAPMAMMEMKMKEKGREKRRTRWHTSDAT